jgi:hypothetical protein
MDLLDGPAYLLHTITVWAPISKGPRKVEYYVEISGPAKLDDRPSNPGPEQPSLRALRRCSPTCQPLTRARLRGGGGGVERAMAAAEAVASSPAAFAIIDGVIGPSAARAAIRGALQPQHW